LIADLRRGGNGNIVNAIRWQVRVAPYKFMECANHQVIRPRLGVYALVTRAPKRRSDGINKYDFTNGT
jgi:hypothetical protein